MIKNLLSGFAKYLKDWKNLLAHTLIGIGILLVAFFLPVSAMMRAGILVGVISFNLLRMRHEKKKDTRGVCSVYKGRN